MGRPRPAGSAAHGWCCCSQFQDRFVGSPSSALAHDFQKTGPRDTNRGAPRGIAAGRLRVGNPARRGYSPRMAHQVHCHHYRVTYADCTTGNHMYYARFLELLEAGRGELFRHLGMPLLHWQQTGLAFPVIECRLRFKALARYDDLLTVEVWATRMERLRLDFAYRIVNPDAMTVVEATTHHVCVSLDGKPRRLPAELVEKLRPYLAAETPPEAAGVANASGQYV